MEPRKFVAVVAGMVMVVGVILLFTGVSAVASGGANVSCGTAISPSMKDAAHQANVDSLSNAMLADAGYGSLGASSEVTGFRQACDDALSTRKVWGFGLLGIGAVALVGSFVVNRTSSRVAES